MLDYIRRKIVKTAMISLLITFISVFLLWEVGFSLVQKEIPEMNDYCFIIKGADLKLTKSTNSTSLNGKPETTFYSFHYKEQYPTNLHPILNTENNCSYIKISQVYIYNCAFLI